MERLTTLKKINEWVKLRQEEIDKDAKENGYEKPYRIEDLPLFICDDGMYFNLDKIDIDGDYYATWLELHLEK